MHPCYHIPELVVKGILNTLPFGKLHNRVVKGWQGKEGPDMPHLRLPTLQCLGERLHRTPPVPPSTPLLPQIHRLLQVKPSRA